MEKAKKSKKKRHTSIKTCKIYPIQTAENPKYIHYYHCYSKYIPGTLTK